MNNLDKYSLEQVFSALASMEFHTSELTNELRNEHKMFAIEFYRKICKFETNLHHEFENEFPDLKLVWENARYHIKENV